MSDFPSSFPLNYYEERSKRLKKNDYELEIRLTDSSSPTYSMVRWHWHEEVEIVYVQKGAIYITCEDQGITANVGDIVFINQQRKHFISPVNEDDFACYSIIFHPVFLLGFGHLELKKKYISPLLDDITNKTFSVRTTDAGYDNYKPLLDEIIQINQDKKTCYELITKSLLLQVWCLIYEHTNQHDKQKKSKMNAQDEHRVKEAILFIQEHFMESITLDDISNSIMVSKSECCRCFKRALNLTPFEYLMKYRIMESTKRMQKRTTESISEIAGSVGFNNTSYFNKIFKKYMDCTPSEYKATMKKDLSSIL